MTTFQYIFVCLWMVSIVGIVNSHTIITKVNGGLTGLRQVFTNSPVIDTSSPQMVCGIDPRPSSGKLKLKPGALISLDYLFLAKSHQGPCIGYIAEAANPTKFTKFFAKGYDKDGVSCNTKIHNTLKLSYNLPSNLKPGKYIVRMELIALHEANGPPPKRVAQFFIQCIDITIEDSDNSTNVGVGDNAVTIPGHVTQTTPGVFFNVYTGKKITDYPMPGPKIDPAFTFGDSD